MARTSTRGLRAGVRIHRKADRLNKAENGTVVRVEVHPVRGAVVWYKSDRQQRETFAPIADVRIVRRKRRLLEDAA
jgi:hypothetical protein